MIAATSLAEALDALRHRGPLAFDAAVLDLQLPDGDGTTLLPILHSFGVPTIVVSGHFPERYPEIVSHNTLGIPKPFSPERLVATIRQLLDRRAQNDARFAEHYGLSHRELEVVAWAAKGLGNAETALEIGCSVRSVREYWERACQKLNTRERRVVIALYRRFHEL